MNLQSPVYLARSGLVCAGAKVKLYKCLFETDSRPPLGLVSSFVFLKCFREATGIRLSGSDIGILSFLYNSYLGLKDF